MASVRVCGVDDLAVKQASRFVVEGVPIAVVKDAAGDVFAIGHTSTHGDIFLAEIVQKIGIPALEDEFIAAIEAELAGGRDA